ncbi:MAG: hypothetical protein KatS3mg044_0274 [Rhodothermaceae bacterium]|nr:MAG: hypothetical protein KatS3mg044_0274 [Rhodothermaceae bacterium]
MTNMVVMAITTTTTARVTYINAGPIYRRTCSMSLVARVMRSPVGCFR